MQTFFVELHEGISGKRWAALYTAVKCGDQVSVRRLPCGKACVAKCRKCSKTLLLYGTWRVPSLV